MMKRGLRMALGKVKRKGFCCLLPVSILVLFSSNFILFYFILLFVI